jgi:hypothetical protein
MVSENSTVSVSTARSRQEGINATYPLTAVNVTRFVEVNHDLDKAYDPERSTDNKGTQEGF